MGFRRVLAVGLLAAVGVAGLAQGQLSVRTDQGVVEGEKTADGKVVAFKGIPYAAAPVGELRWKPPVPAQAWVKPFAAKSFGHRCLQMDGYDDMYFHDSGGSEDCLNLNVWTPVGAKPGSLPVMVWIYGGGSVTGGTSESRQNGEWLAHRDVVVVSMNYRLGIFGFMSLPGLTAESAHHASGNYGLMDQTAALAWVHQNIAAFGGDAKRVTIFGESAGSFAVSTLMASPLSKGLFQRAIGESGGAFPGLGRPALSQAELETRNAAFVQGKFGTVDVGDLRKVAADDILRSVISPAAMAGAVGGKMKASATAMATPHFGPNVDGYFLPEPVAAIYAAGGQAHVPMMAGWNADEGRGQIVQAKTPTTAASFTAQGETEFGIRAPEFRTLYPVGDDAQAVNSAADYAGDKFIAFSTWRWLESQVKTGGAPVYRYFFTLGSPGDDNHSAATGAFHSDDIEYVFGTLDSRGGAIWRPEDRKLSDQMMRYWTSFAKTGNPNTAGLPLWPKYEAGKWELLELGAESHAGPDTRRGRYVFLDQSK